MKNVLMIAYHFPPLHISSGLQRTLKFATYLLEHGWKAQILSVTPKIYPLVSDDQVREIPSEVMVTRSFAVDTARHFAFRGRYISWLGLPDRWVSWCFTGVFDGLCLIKKYRPQVIWSTYPIATAHLLGLILHRLTGKPWVADFRDIMTEADYPSEPTKRKCYLWIEQQTIKYCSRAVFTSPGALEMYGERYPDIPKSRFVIIPNGYDEENFARAEHSEAYGQALASKTNQIILLHSGILYPSERDPRQFFAALAELKQTGKISPERFKIILRATGHDYLHSRYICENDLRDIVFLEPSIPYEAALAEMLTVDGLLVFQAANCNNQIPAKIYEYLRAHRPILALTDPSGDTSKELLKAGITNIAPLDDKETIVTQIASFIDNLQEVKRNAASDEVIASYSRQNLTKLLADILNDVS